MKGAATPIAAAFRRQRYIGADHIHDIIAGDQLVNKILRKQAASPPFRYRPKFFLILLYGTVFKYTLFLSDFFKKQKFFVFMRSVRCYNEKNM